MKLPFKYLGVLPFLLFYVIFVGISSCSEKSESLSALLAQKVAYQGDLIYAANDDFHLKLPKEWLIEEDTTRNFPMVYSMTLTSKKDYLEVISIGKFFMEKGSTQKFIAKLKEKLGTSSIKLVEEIKGGTKKSRDSFFLVSYLDKNETIIQKEIIQIHPRTKNEFYLISKVIQKEGGEWEEGDFALLNSCVLSIKFMR